MSIFSKMLGGGKLSADSSPTKETRWLGASRVVRSLASWVAQVGSGTSDFPSTEMRTLRARSRDAFRAHTIARAAITRSKTNIVGSGIMCRPHIDYAVLGISEDEAATIDSELQSQWSFWAENAIECDAEATLNFYGLQGLVQLNAMLSGDVFALTPFEKRNGGISGLKVQLIEADRIENNNNEANREGLFDGVVLSPIGQPLGYWIRSNHPGDSIVSASIPFWTFYPAYGEETGRRRVMHVWNEKERAGQVRGAPFLAPILEPLRQISKYSDNELMAAVVSALFTVFIEKPAEVVDSNGNFVSAFGESANPDTYSPPPSGGVMSLGNGAIIDGAPGEKFNFANPARPNAQFDAFISSVTKSIGAALELPMDELMLHYQASYSAARAAMLQAWRFYITRRELLVSQFCEPIYGLWLDEQVASGRINLPGYADPKRRHAYSRCTWIGPSRGAMDELKEAQAAEKRIAIGVSNEAIECEAMTGLPRDSIYNQRLREINQRKADGTYIDAPKETIRVAPLDDPMAEPQPPSEPLNTVPSPADAGLRISGASK